MIRASTAAAACVAAALAGSVAFAQSASGPFALVQTGAQRDIQALSGFFADLAALERGARTQAVTVLHIGDSHIATDALSEGVRDALQRRFGDAGRGFVQPPKSYPHQRLPGYETSVDGAWSGVSSLKTRSGPFGVAGLRLSAREAGARLAVTPKPGTRPAGRVWARFLAQPGGGRFLLSHGAQSVEVRTNASRTGGGSAWLDGASGGVEINHLGGGPVTLLGLGFDRPGPGVRYVNLGVPGATALTTRSWDPSLVVGDVAAIAPSLIVVGFGTNESRADELSAERYRQAVDRLLGLLRAGAPGVSLVVMGPPSALRAADRGPGAPCGRGDWLVPPATDRVRGALRAAAAAAGGAFWDWAEAMGGPCAMTAWVAADPPLGQKDRVHMTRAAGYPRSAALFYGWLMARYEARPR